MGILLSLRGIGFFIYTGLVFGLTQETIFTVRYNSNIHIAFICLLAIVMCFKYDIIKIIFETCKKYKLIFSMIVIIVVFALINLLYIIPLDFEPKNWLDMAYNGETHLAKEIDHFIFLPEFIDTLNIFNMTLIESIFSIIYVIIAKVRESINENVNTGIYKPIYGQVGYILERLTKDIYKYKALIIFYLYLLTLPSKYLTVYNLKLIGAGIIFLAVMGFTVKNYLSLKKCSKKNKEKYGKENLIIVMSSNNYKFFFTEDIINPLHKFNKFDTKSIGKSLLVDGKKYTFVSNDAIRYKLINPEEYQNVAYVIFYKLSFKTYFGNLYSEEEGMGKEIKNIRKETNKFIIFSNFETWIVSSEINKIKQKYIFRFRSKFDLKAILDIVHLKENDVLIKEKAMKEQNYIYDKELDNYLEKTQRINKEDSEFEKAKQKIKLIEEIDDIDNKKITEEEVIEPKNKYIKFSLKNIIDSFNYTEYFYSLLKICEYVMHYMALKNIISNPKEILDKKIKIEKGTLSVWRDCLEYDKIYEQDIEEDNNLITAIKEIREILELENNYRDDYKFTFKKDVCNSVINIRNKLLGHGVITYDLSEQIVINLFTITSEFIKVFETVEVTIEEDEIIKDIFNKDFKAIYNDNKQIFLYNMANIEKEKDNKYTIYPEYLNYETGKRKVIDKKISKDLNLKFSNQEIEKALAKWVIK